MACHPSEMELEPQPHVESVIIEACAPVEEEVIRYAIEQGAYFRRLLTLKLAGAKRYGRPEVADLKWKVGKATFAQGTLLAFETTAQHFQTRGYEVGFRMTDNSHWASRLPGGPLIPQPATEWTGTLEVSAPDC